MRSLKHIGFLFLPVLVYMPARAQSTNVGNWIGYFGNQGFNKRWNWHNEVQLRNYNFIGDLQQLMFRTGIGYNLTENNNNILLGYAYVHSRNYVGEGDQITESDEQRIFQQFITKQAVGRVLFTHRYRFEERSIATEWSYRLRYQFSVQVALNKPAMGAGAFYTSTNAEVFLNTKAPVFDRYRLYGALGYGIKSWLRVEFGYMRQGLETGHRDQFQIGVYNNLRLDKD